MSATDDTQDAETLAATAAKLVQLLRLRTLPVGLKLFADVEAMMRIPGIRTPPRGKRFSTCQLITQSRYNGTTLGIVHDNLLPNSNCGGVIGLNQPGENYLSGAKMDGVWFDNRAAARAHQAEMPRVPAGRYQGMVVSPLRGARLDPPDICLFYATPGQMILFVTGLQRRTYRRYNFTITGESACADSWGRALATGETSISIPCYAERRFGGVADDELLIALPVAELVAGVDGLVGLHEAGLRYPIVPYGISIDPEDGLRVSYAPRSRAPD